MKKILLIILLAGIQISANAQDSTKHKRNIFQKVKLPGSKSKEEKAEAKEAAMLPMDSISGRVTYTEVVQAKGMTKKTLADKSKKWLKVRNSITTPYTLRSSQVDGMVEGKGSFMIPSGAKQYEVHFNINIAAKDGRYKYDFTDFTLQYKLPEGAAQGRAPRAAATPKEEPTAARTGRPGKTPKEAPVADKSPRPGRTPKETPVANKAPRSVAAPKEAPATEYSLETFYPSRLNSKLPTIKFFEDVDADFFATLDKEMKSIASSLKQSIASAEDNW